MGMDLHARSKDMGLHFNWSGWAKFGNFLISVKCPIESMRSSNNGDYIPAKECRSYANAIIKNKDKFFKEYFMINPLDPCVGYITPVARYKEIIQFFQNCSGCRQF